MLRIGDEPIPGYRLEKFLGRGQFGQVWKTSAPGGGSAALKFLDLSGKEGWKEFKGVQRVKEIRHAHLMPITAFWLLDDDGNILDDDEVQAVAPPDSLRDTILPGEVAQPASPPHWLVIAQLLGEKTLMDELEERQEAGEQGIPLPQLLTYFEEAAKGIDFLNSERHDLGNGVYAVQHCDVKPANMLLVGGSVLVCDFGLAQILLSGDIDTRSTGMQGSPAYIAPECIAERPSATSDQYSLAISYYELRTGLLPFEDQTPLGALDAHRSGNLKLVDIPPAELAVLTKATSLDPQSRYPNCATFVRELKAATGIGSLRPTTAPGWSSLIAKVAVTIAAILVAVAAVILVGQPDETGPGNGGGRPAAEVSFQVTPRDATLTVDGNPHRLTDGRLKLEKDANAKLKLVVTREDFETKTLNVDLSDRDLGEPIVIELDRSGIFMAKSAMDKLWAGDRAGAIADYARAIGKDSRFATFPEAVELHRPPADDPSVEMRFVEMSRNGKWLVAADARGAVRVWPADVEFNDTSTSTIVHQHQEPVRSLAVGNDWAVTADAGGHIFASQLGTAGRQPKRFQLKTFGDIKLAVSRDDRYIVSGHDGELQRWDLRAPDLARSGQPMGKHDDFIEVIRVPPDNESVITGSWDGLVKRWPLQDRQLGQGKRLGALSDDVYVVDVSTSQVAMAGAESESENSVFVAGLDGRNLRPLPGSHPSPIVALSFDTSGKWLAAGSEDDGRVSVWHQESASRWTRVPLPSQHTDTVQSVVFGPESKYLYSAGNDGMVLLWDLEAQRERVVRIAFGLAPVTQLRITTDGHWLIAAGVDGHVRAWDLRQCTLVKQAADTANTKAEPPGATTSGFET